MRTYFHTVSPFDLSTVKGFQFFEILPPVNNGRFFARIAREKCGHFSPGRTKVLTVFNPDRTDRAGYIILSSFR